ncbi:MAG: DUF4258 domain-containing protein [bacterium]|nr:DUF4258 domain-containing protein [bacterium]
MRSLPELPIVYTRHAKGRMRWRRISADMIVAVLRDPDRVDHVAPGRIHVWKTAGGRKLRVIVAVEPRHLVVITAMEQS